MSDIDYKIFSDDSLAKLDRTRWAIAKAGYLGAEIPSSLEGKLRDAETQYEEAEKKFLFKDKEEAIRDVQKVNRYADAVSEAAEELYFKACFQKVCDVHDSYRDHEDLAAQYIPDYKIHKENLRDIKKRRENNGKLLWGQACSDNDQLQSFLDAFELVKKELFVAIKKAERTSQLEEKIVQLEEESVGLKKETVRQGNEIIQLKKNQSWLRILSVGAAVISALVGVKSCVSDTSSQQVTQPEARDSEAEITS